ncbi:MAG: alpha/beta hydrolase [Alphaproteobacteria bacterium]|nr:alpha/beta hydrolase [Alphaproteobacteria bacterium]
MSPIKALLLAGLFAFLSACSPVPVLNLLVPRGGYDVQQGFAYGPDPRQKLDVYVPQGLKGPAPVLLFIYGGAWSSGRRDAYLALGQAFATKGIVTVVADYRLYPQVKYPAFVEDAAGALAWVHGHIAEHGGDPGRIFVSGHSAGAYNAVMLAAEPKFIEAAGGKPDWIRGVIGIAGPYDFLPLTEPQYIDIFHGAHNEDAMPINHVDGKRPPMLLVAGDADATVGPGNSDRMAARLKSFGNQAQVIKYPGVGHIGIILSLAPGFRGRTTLRQDILDFIHAH